MYYNNINKTILLKVYEPLSKAKRFFLKSFKLLTITDIRVINNLIHFSYNLKIATRFHHLPTSDKYELPDAIINSFAFKYFPELERDFLLSCKASNDLFSVNFYLTNYEFIKLSTGKELMIMIYDNKVNKNVIEFTIKDLSKFTGLCRRYQTPVAVENMISNMFGKYNNVRN